MKLNCRSIAILGVSVFCVMLSGCGVIGQRPEVLAMPGDDLQAVLDGGNNLVLNKGSLYEMHKALEYKFPHQKISTKDAVHISDYAVLRIANPELMQLINASGKKYVTLERVTLDGNRYRISTVPKIGPGGGGQPALAFFGGDGGKGQKILNNVFMSTRTWATLKIHEGATGTVAKGNIVLGAGVDPRGNGREKGEKPFSWGDAISCASRNSLVRNNLIIDPTDVGIVFYGAPGSVAKDNVISVISRESLGGINMVDALKYYAIDEEGTRIDYRRVVIDNNYIDAYGARIHMAMPMGGPPWVPVKTPALVGATVKNNTIAGGAAAYGYVVNGVDNFTVINNKSIATYSGIGEGLGSNRPPDEPGAFLYDPKNVGDSKLQEEFKPAKRHLLHLLRCNHGPTNELGYRVYGYGDKEVEAVVKAAYLEMLGRDCSDEDLKQKVDWLQKNKATADQLRRDMMATDEFKNKFGQVDPEDLHLYRVGLWVGILDGIRKESMAENGKMPTAKQMYFAALKKLYR